MKTWILGTEYDFSDTKSVNRLLDVIDSCGVNSVRQIALGLVTTVISLASQNDKQTGELPTEYYCLSCIDEVITAMKEDIEKGDWTAIAELLQFVPKEVLDNYLGIN